MNNLTSLQCIAGSPSGQLCVDSCCDVCPLSIIDQCQMQFPLKGSTFYFRISVQSVGKHKITFKSSDLKNTLPKVEMIKIEKSCPIPPSASLCGLLIKNKNILLLFFLSNLIFIPISNHLLINMEMTEICNFQELRVVFKLFSLC